MTGHFNHPHSRPWKHVDAPLTPHLAKLIGAQESEVAHTSTLTSNMHNLFMSFYRPTKTRWKIVIEKGSFPSDWVYKLLFARILTKLKEQYAVHSHPQLHSAILSPEQIRDAIIPLSPRAGEETLWTEDILATLESHRDEVCSLDQTILSTGLTCIDSYSLATPRTILYRPTLRYPSNSFKIA